MACIGKCIFRTALIGGLALGGATLLLGPDRMLAGFDCVKTKVQHVVDDVMDDPVALRRELAQLANELPEKIADIEGEISIVDRQIVQLGSDTEVARGVVAKATTKMEDLHSLLTRAAATRESTGQDVQVRYNGNRYDLRGAREAFNRYSAMRTSYQDRLAANERDLQYLGEQRDRLIEYVGRLQTEYTTIQTQMYQIDRKIEAIARNERLVDALEEREKSLAEFDTTFDMNSLEQLQAKLDKWETEVSARLERFDRQTEWRDLEEEVKFEIQQEQNAEEIDFETWDDFGREDANSVVLAPQIIE